MNKCRLTSLIRLSHLAPEIVGALLAARHPIELTPAAMLHAGAGPKVPRASGLAGLLKPTWLSEICRKLKPLAAFSAACAVWMARSCDDFCTPPLSVQIMPLPAQIIHSSAP